MGTDMSTSPAADADLARDRAFATFYREYFPQLIGFLIAFGAKPVEAADAAQDAMVQAYRDWDRISSPWAWVVLVARRRWMNSQSRKSHREYLVPEVPDRAGPAGPDRDLRIDLADSLARLPRRQRQVIALALAGLDTVDIAHLMKVTPSTVRTLQQRARHALAQQMNVADSETSDQAQQAGPETQQ